MDSIWLACVERLKVRHGVAPVNKTRHKVCELMHKTTTQESEELNQKLANVGTVARIESGWSVFGYIFSTDKQ